MQATQEGQAAILMLGDWKRLGEFDLLLLFRALRPDRLTAAVSRFVANTIGSEFTSSQAFDLEKSIKVICG